MIYFIKHKTSAKIFEERRGSILLLPIYIMFNSKLEAEIAELEKENEELRKELFCATEKELFKTSKSYTNVYRKLFYRSVPLKMITTPFYYKKYELAEKVTACFIPEILDRALECSKFHYDQECVMWFAMFCENAILTSAGIVFTLSDPYRTIQTKPVTTISQEDAVNYIGKLLIVKLVITDNYKTDQTFTLKGIKTTNYAQEYKNTHEEWSEIKKHLNVSGEAECRKALDELQIYFIDKYKIGENNTIKLKCAYERNNDFELRVRTLNRVMVFYMKNGILMYADEKWDCTNEGLEMYFNITEILFGDTENFRNVSFMLPSEEHWDVVNY